MTRVLIFGNSGSGKTTRAKAMAEKLACFHLDLDTVAWIEGHQPPTRKPLSDSDKEIRRLLAGKRDWVIEGCYSDLLGLVLPQSTEILFLNPGVETCVRNCRNRPWEPHKYDSPDAQNANLDMLIGWIKHYSERDDEFSLQAHRKLFDEFEGKKTECTVNESVE